MIRRTRLKYEDQYTQIPNAWMRDKRLSRRARGLLAEITTHRINWRITIASLQAGGPEGREAIRAGINELIAAGYLIRVQKRSEGGRMQEIEYELCDPSAETDSQECATSDDELSTEITAAQEPVSGADQGLSEPDPSSPQVSPLSGLPTSAEPTSVEPTTAEPPYKKNISREDHLEGGAPAPAPTCSSHPNGTTQPCRGCQQARLDVEEALRRAAAWAAEEAAAARADRYPTHVYCPHLELRTRHCEACAQDARKALEAAGYQTAGAA